MHSTRTSWFGDMASRHPFEVYMPPSSNGYVNVRDKNGNELATCSGSEAAYTAAAIVAALNEAYAPSELVEPEEAPETYDYEPAAGYEF